MSTFVKPNPEQLKAFQEKKKSKEEKIITDLKNIQDDDSIDTIITENDIITILNEVNERSLENDVLLRMLKSISYMDISKFKLSQLLSIEKYIDKYNIIKEKQLDKITYFLTQLKNDDSTTPREDIISILTDFDEEDITFNLDSYSPYFIDIDTVAEMLKSMSFMKLDGLNIIRLKKIEVYIYRYYANTDLPIVLQHFANKPNKFSIDILVDFFTKSILKIKI